jgi:transitional endoplasmic reticulum ATPase
MVFIDEISGLLPKRESLTGSQQYRESEINEFLIHLESAGTKNILVVGATNFPERLDSAALRSGRMDKRIFISPPDYAARVELFKLELEDRPIDIDLIPEVLGNLSDGYLASDIRLVVDNAARKALLEKRSINMDHLRDALKKRM